VEFWSAALIAVWRLCRCITTQYCMAEPQYGCLHYHCILEVQPVKGYGQWNTCVRNAFTQQYTPCSFSSLQAPCTKATATATEYKSNELLFSTANYRLNLTALHNAYSTEDLLFTKHSKQIETQTARCIHVHAQLNYN
jgi:hypothetical protein